RPSLPQHLVSTFCLGSAMPCSSRQTGSSPAGSPKMPTLAIAISELAEQLQERVSRAGRATNDSSTTRSDLTSDIPGGLIVEFIDDLFDRRRARSPST